MQIPFFGGSLHQRQLTIAGEQNDIPVALKSPFGDTRETYVRHAYRSRGREEVIFVLSGYRLTPDDVRGELKAG